MANFEEKVKREHIELARFGGLDRAGALCSDKHSFELRNFRLLEDGSLACREGFLPVCTFEGEVRGAFCTMRHGVKEVYVVAGEGVYAMSEDCRAASLIGQLDTTQGEVCFLAHEGRVLLLDGEELWCVSPQEILRVQGYVPLYGDGWSTQTLTGREVCEPINFLSRQVRINFVSDENRLLILSDIVPQSVDFVEVNGRLSEAWSYNAYYQSVRLDESIEPGSRITVWLTLPQGMQKDRSCISRAARADAIGDAEQAQLLFYGGGVPSGQLWFTRPISTQQRSLVQAVEPQACMLYLTDEDVMMLGDGLARICGACRHYDRSLIFTENGTWMTDGTLSQEGRMRMIPVNTTLGCTDLGGFCVQGNDPMTLFGRRLLCWNSETDERNECNATDIARPVQPLMPQEGGRRGKLFSHPCREEVWLYWPAQKERILVWQGATKSWTSFDGFDPTGVIAIGEQVVFFEGRSLFLFDAAALTDTDGVGERRTIEAQYRSSYLDLGHVGRTKRLCGVTLTAQGEGAQLELELQNVNGKTSSLTLRTQGDGPCVLQGRGHIGRFRFLRVGITGRGGSPRLLGLRLTVQG